MSDGAAGTVMALYLSSVYLLSLPGGWIADRFLGQRKAVTIGGIGIALGNAMLAMPTTRCSSRASSVIALGTGFLKPNVSTIVGQLYKRDDPRRDAGFTIYYMGINIGAGVAPLVGVLVRAEPVRSAACSTSHGIDPNLCWKVAFAVPAVGMVARPHPVPRSATRSSATPACTRRSRPIRRRRRAIARSLGGDRDRRSS